jgi:pyruvate formate lyase activating enzyme
MKIKGIQKLTLIDYPEKLACIIFLFECNFRCGFCHNPELVIREGVKDYSEEEVLNFLKEKKKYLEGVCITGGEPLLDLNESFLKKIKDMGYLIKLDTNGSFPEKLERIMNHGLVDFIAMDVKASKERYSEITNAQVDLQKIEQSIKLISEFSEYEFRTTIIEDFHDLEEIKKIAVWINNIVGKRGKKFCLQAFKNKGKFVGEDFNFKRDVPEDYVLNLKKVVEGYFEKVEIR